MFRYSERISSSSWFKTPARWPNPPLKPKRRYDLSDEWALRAIRAATSLIQQQPEYGIALFEKGMRLDRAIAKEFYGLFRDQYNPELSLPDATMEELLAVGTFRAKDTEKVRVNLQAVRDWSFAEKARR